MIQRFGRKYTAIAGLGGGREGRSPNPILSTGINVTLLRGGQEGDAQAWDSDNHSQLRWPRPRQHRASKREPLLMGSVKCCKQPTSLAAGFGGATAL